MTRILHGRGGLENSTAAIARFAALAVICLVLGAAACSSKKPAGAGSEGIPPGGNLGEQNQSGSLAALQSGSVGSDSGPLHDIHFGYNEYNIEPQDSSILKDNASWLNQHGNTHVQVEGHCDERGSEEYNIALGARRAQSAKDYLLTLGIAGSRISTISYGKELPLCQDHDESCWSRNRRDHFVVSGQQ